MFENARRTFSLYFFVLKSCLTTCLWICRSLPPPPLQSQSHLPALTSRESLSNPAFSLLILCTWNMSLCEILVLFCFFNCIVPVHMHIVFCVCGRCSYMKSTSTLNVCMNPMCCQISLPPGKFPPAVSDCGINYKSFCLCKLWFNLQRVFHTSRRKQRV